MCFDANARPPAAPRSGNLGDSKTLTLRAADGNTLFAAQSSTKDKEAPGVVILPDVRGLHHFYAHLAETVADAGFHAIAVDPYGRTAGAELRADDFDYAPHRAAASDAGLTSDAQAAVSTLADAGADKVIVWGFCFGGRGAFMQASQEGVAGAIGFYGWPTRKEEGGSSPVEEAVSGKVRAPVLAIYGGGDDKIPEQDRAAYDNALSGAGVPHETVVYPGAPHSFFDRTMAKHEAACEDAWRRVLAFLEGSSP